MAEGLARRGVPVIVASGYAHEIPQGFRERVRPAAIFEKPVNPRALLETVRAVVAFE